MTFRTLAHKACARPKGAPHFGLGHIPDTKRSQKPAHLLVGTAPSAPPDISLVAFEAPIEDQARTSSCGGHGTSQAVYTSAGAVGKPLSFVPSPRLLYALARIQNRQDASQTLTDSGVMPSDLIDVLRLWGVAPIQAPTPDGRYSDVWSQDDLDAAKVSGAPNINDEPSLLELEASGLRLVTGDYRIDETAPNFGNQLREALFNRCAIGIGIFVDTKNFMWWDASTGPIKTIDLSDPNGGGHWLALTYTYITPSGMIVFGGPNSWSTAWPTGTAVPGSPFWKPGHWEMTLDCLQRVTTDCILFPIQVVA